MSFGERLKSIRHKKGFSQPELAEIAGIEQSYLSKLENDKSLPSNDIFRNILNALEIRVDTFIEGIDKKALAGKLKSIPDIEQFLLQEKQRNVEVTRRYLYICSFMVAIGITLFYAGYTKILFSEWVYEYKSEGIVLAGEQATIFETWDRLIPDGSRNRELWQAKKLEMAQRSDVEFLILSERKAPSFTLAVEGGKRHYEFIGSKRKSRTINSVFQLLGVFLFVSGLIGFFLERKFQR